jgi:hypothetical protein
MDVKKRFTDEQIIGFLKRADGGIPASQKRHRALGQLLGYGCAWQLPPPYWNHEEEYSELTRPRFCQAGDNHLQSCFRRKLPLPFCHFYP